MTMPQPQPAPPAWNPPAQAVTKRPVKVWDVVVTIILLVGVAVVAALASLMGMFLVMASDPCGSRDCSTELITIGWLMGMILPWVVLIATAVVAIVLLVKRRLAFWVPLIGAVAVVLSLVLAFMVTSMGVPGSSV